MSFISAYNAELLASSDLLEENGMVRGAICLRQKVFSRHEKTDTEGSVLLVGGSYLRGSTSMCVPGPNGPQCIHVPTAGQTPYATMSGETSPPGWSQETYWATRITMFGYIGTIYVCGDYDALKPESHAAILRFVADMIESGDERWRKETRN